MPKPLDIAIGGKLGVPVAAAKDSRHSSKIIRADEKNTGFI